MVDLEHLRARGEEITRDRLGIAADVQVQDDAVLLELGDHTALLVEGVAAVVRRRDHGRPGDWLADRSGMPPALDEGEGITGGDAP